MATVDLEAIVVRNETTDAGLPADPVVVRQESRYENFDYLRLFLALEVVAEHCWAGLLLPGAFWSPIPPVAAFVGLSGFLIPQSLERSKSLPHFAWKRALRTLPALLPVFAALGWAFGLQVVLGAAKQYLTAGYYGQVLGVTLPLWSLIVEDALYAFTALLFVFGLHRNLWCALAILTALLAGERFVTDAMTDYRLFHTSTAFFVGNLINIFHSSLRRVHWIVPGLGVGISLMGWCAPLGNLARPFLIANVIVLAISLPQMRWRIPDLSYGAYIWHGPIMMYLLVTVGMARDARWVIAVSIGTLIAALLSWYGIEKPALRLKKMSSRLAATQESEPRPTNDKGAAAIV